MQDLAETLSMWADTPNALRVGSEGRTLYEQRTASPRDDDKLVGVMDSPALAARVVHSWNELTRLRNVEMELAEALEAKGYRESRYDLAQKLADYRHESETLRAQLVRIGRAVDEAIEALDDDRWIEPNHVLAREKLGRAKQELAETSR